MARGNEILLRTLGDFTTHTDGVQHWLEVAPPRKCRKDRHAPEVAVIPVGYRAPVQLQQVISKAAHVRTRVMKRKGLDPLDTSLPRFINPDGHIDGGWRSKPWTSAIRSFFAAALPSQGLDTSFTTHTTRRTGATLAAAGGFLIEDLCK